MAQGSSAAAVDVLVVGAGPGGSTAAFFLARHGVDVALADKAAFPREKPCGDGLTPRAVKVLLEMGIDTEDPGFARVEGLRIYGRNASLELPWPVLSEWPGYGLVRTRHGFDHLLVQHAEKAGAQLWESNEAVEPIQEDGWTRGARLREVNEDDKDGPVREVRARFVIAADGASSRFGQPAGVKRDATRPLGIAARRYYRSEHPRTAWLESWLDLWEGDALLPGYGWVFPLPDGTVNVGAGLLNTFTGFKDVSAQRLFDAFVAMIADEWGLSEETAEGRVLSGSLPMGMNRRPLAMPGLLLVGDAAGLVNPFNGEGISYAMESGRLAAELVYESLVLDRPGLAQVYPTELRRRYGRYFHIGRTFVRAIGKPAVMRTLTRYGLPREGLMRFAMRFMANLTDGPSGDAQDRLMDALLRLSSPN